MKRLKYFLIIFVLVFTAFGCGKTAADGWQKQYDLGMRYLTEKNYENAVLAFTMAIEIDPNIPEAYLGLADTYFALDDIELVIESLKIGFEKTKAVEIEKRLYEYGYSYISSEEAILLYNLSEYQTERNRLFEEHKEVDSFCIEPGFGIRFEQTVTCFIDNKNFDVTEAGLSLSESSGLSWEDLDYSSNDSDDLAWDVNWDYIGRKMMVSGFISYDSDYQRVELNGVEPTFRPNGPFVFELTEWQMDS